jgi:hypothetical protein
VESFQKQLAPQQARLQEMGSQLLAQDQELVGGMSALVALRRQVSGRAAGWAALGLQALNH